MFFSRVALTTALLAGATACTPDYVTFKGPQGDIAVCQNPPTVMMSSVGGALEKCREAYIKNGYVEVGRSQ